MKRYFFEVAYDGTSFFGWQKQPEQKSVQGTIENAFTKLNSNIPISITGCGRTDTGVHASFYVFHADFPKEIDAQQWHYKLNKMLPDTITVHKVIVVEDDMHARFSAKERTYRYFIHQKKNPFQVRFSTFFRQELDENTVKEMNLAANFLLGEHDFTTFSKVNTDVKSHICTVSKAEWQFNKGELHFTITANRFLRNMVRAIVGTLLQVGLGKLSPQEFKEALEAQNRSKSAASAPPQGLHLWRVEY